MSQGVNMEPSWKAVGMCQGWGGGGLQQVGVLEVKRSGWIPGLLQTELPPFLTDVGHDGEQAKMAYMFSAWQLQRRKIAMNCIGGKAQMEQIFGRWCGDGNQSRYETCSM